MVIRVLRLGAQRKGMTITMIIDAHAHVGLHNIPGHYRDEDCEALYKKYGICKGMFSSMVSLLGELEKGNAGMYEYVRRFDFAYGYVVVTPNRVAESLNEMKKYLGREKIVGLKYHAHYAAHSIDDPKLAPVLEAFHQYRQVMLVHCEHTDPNSHPARLGNIAGKYPSTKFIIAHHACALWEEACAVAAAHPNVYMDMISSWNEFDVIARIVERIGEDKLMYGSDTGLFDPAPFIGSVLSSRVSEDVKHKIFYKNAARLFGFE